MKGLLIVHVAVGFAGLTAFWVPIFTRKGGVNHRRFGRLYRNCAYIVLATAGAAVALRIGSYLAQGDTPATQPRAFGFLVFLGYLSLATFVIVRHGVGVLAHKGKPGDMATPLNRALALAAIAASLLLVVYGLVLSPPNSIVLFALSPIGLLSGIGILRYVGQPPLSPRAWMYEHIGAMLGGGIAFHTAFAVFGSARLFDIGLTGWGAVVPWLAPAVIGIPATAIWTRHYRRKFGESG